MQLPCKLGSSNFRLAVIVGEQAYLQPEEAYLQPEQAYLQPEEASR